MRTAVALYVGFGLLIVSCVLAIISIRNLGWAFQEVDNPPPYPDAKVYYGLFTYCTEVGDAESCHDYPTSTDKREAANGLAVSGMVGYILATISVAVFMFLYYRNRTVTQTKVPLIISLVFTALGVIFSIVAVILYSQILEDELPDGADPFYCPYLLVTATLLAIVGSIVAFKGRPEGVPQFGPVIMTHGNVSIIPNHQQMQQQQGGTAMNPAYPTAYPPAYAPAYPPAYQSSNPGMHQYPPTPQILYTPPAKQ